MSDAPGSRVADGDAPLHAPAAVGVGAFALGTVLLGIMAVAAHGLAYFAFDPAISHLVQAYHPAWLDAFTTALSWTGFPPQSNVLFGG
ncbi:MAG TPA: hypothetical protein VF937_04185, partial [Chloroflexota bacterium]